MHIDARKLENGSIIEGDICIVGAGISGISLALEWLNSEQKVILLEGGGFEYDDKVQELYNGKNTGYNYFPLKATRLHQFGGTSALWAGACSPIDEFDFKKRDWIPHSGWPISKMDLDKYYVKAHEILDLGPFNYELDYWLKKDPSFSTLPLNNNVFWNKIWQFSPPTRFSKKYKNTIENSSNIYLYTYANVVNLTSNKSIDRIQDITIKNYTGNTHTVRAKQFILACGAIQNSRLLLASNKQVKNGLGNQNDLVGRFFMEHIEFPSGELWFTKEQSMNLYHSNKLTHTSTELALKENIQSKYQILNGTISFSPLRNMKVGKSKIQNLDSEIDKQKKINLQETLVDRFKHKFLKFKTDQIKNIQKAYQLYIRMEQAPNPNSRILLSKEKDSLGVPYANLNWELTSLEKKSLRKIIEILGLQIGISDIGRVKLSEYLSSNSNHELNGGFHHMGTTRMSDNPKNGVVDRNCKVFGIENLFVAGSACFPTAGAPNPTLTIVALSLRLSDYIKNLEK